MPIKRRDLEILLDAPARSDYVVSAYADLRVQPGFRRYAEVELGNLARSAQLAMNGPEARRALDDHLEPILRAVESADPGARGIAAFSSPSRGLFHVIRLNFPVENRLVIDEEPFVLPLLEHWYGVPSYLLAVVDSRQLQLFEAFAGVPESVGGVSRQIDRDTQRDKPGFTYKRRFSHTFYEHLHDLSQDDFLKQAAATIAEHMASGSFQNLILLGQPPVTSAVRRLLPRDAAAAVVDEHPQPMTSRADDLESAVAKAIDDWRHGQRARLLGELRERLARGHLVANGPSAVLDALQQGRATDVMLGLHRAEMPGARCHGCGYRFGQPTPSCPYCGEATRAVDAAQEILRLALRQQVARVHLMKPNGEPDALTSCSGVAAFLRAEANWSPLAAAV